MNLILIAVIIIFVVDIATLIYEIKNRKKVQQSAVNNSASLDIIVFRIIRMLIIIIGIIFLHIIK